jgi:hypothetical protein
MPAMDTRELARLLLKLFGLVVVISAIGQIPSLLLDLALGLSASGPNVQRPDFMIAWSFNCAGDLVTLIVGLIIVRFAGSIVNRSIVSGAGDAPDDVGLSGIEDVAVAVLGFFFFALGLSGAVGQLIRELNPIGSHFSWREFVQQQMSFAGEAWMRMLLGIVFMLRSRSLVAWRRGLVALRPLARDRDPPP